MNRSQLVVVTGSTGGIGRAICHRLTEDGYSVLAAYGQDHASAQTLTTELSSSGRSLHVASSDLSSRDGLDGLVKAVDRVVSDRGYALYGLVNNAALLTGPSMKEATVEQFDKYFAVNTKAAFFLTQALTERMEQGGSIVNISSANAHFSSPGDIVYAMSKAALESLTRNAAEALAPQGIRVNNVVPGFTDNGHPAFQNPRVREYMSSFSVLGGVADPTDVADAVSFLISERSSRTTGSSIDVTGGSTLGARLGKKASVRHMFESTVER
ncbi:MULTISPECIES: SDR family NAD(P)-dependent oxidoreductase [unclassified Microbacterium]|uniref:SDR family NAD(P)-dependent oxidoreductase n=1 Tax=unclassified Microbacterium TaxID=2609290 RepID=UPI0015FF9CF2|nr:MULTISPECIES: SDR family oxidoreductase [unclassified Microbacterium]MBT2486604.1 SDR family oxidoreductase [Microbacterium sp. ISL-108]